MRPLEAAALTAALAFAAPARATTLTWAEARARAEQWAPELAAAARRRDLAATEVHVAGALANPSLTITTAKETAKLSTGVVLPLPIFGQRGVAVQAARAEADVAAQEVEVVRHELRWNATMTWVDAWEAGERARLLQGNAEDGHRLNAIAEERFAAGAGPRLDVVRAAAAAAVADAEAGGARPLVAAAAARLSVWVGGDPIAPDGVGGGPGVPSALPPLPGLANSVVVHPAMARDRAQQAAADRRIELERRLRFPIVSAELVVNQGDPTLANAQGQIPTDVIVGASFELPVLSLRGGAVARAEAQRALADATLVLDAAHLRADVVDAYRRTEAAAARARSLGARALPATEEARSMTEESYRAGRADLVRVLEAQRAVVDARLAEVDAIAAWARAFADLERAAGGGLTETGIRDARQ
jgi:outer membrane protein, heavy metal efflux system